MANDASLWDRYHDLLHSYLKNGEEEQLRAVVALSQEPALTLETTSGRVAASVRAVLSAYRSAGAHSVDVAVERASHSPPASAVAEIQNETRITLQAPEIGVDQVVIEVSGEHPDGRMPSVRLDYVSPLENVGDNPAARLRRPIEPRQLYDVLSGLLAHKPRAGVTDGSP